MKKYFLTFSIIFFSAVRIAFTEESAHEKLIRAGAYLQEHKYEEAMGQLSLPFDDTSLEKKRLLLRGIVFTWMEKWDTAPQELNRVIKDETSRTPEPYARPVRLPDGPASSEFFSQTFSYDDVLYLWRTLWQEHIAARITAHTARPMETVVRLVDYVYRHTQFGTVREGFIADKPFNILIKGKGFCDEQAWLLNQLLRAAGFDALRLLLVSPYTPTSPHTMSMVKINDDWIPLDASNGIILRSATSRRPKTFPQNFLINPTKKDYDKFGNTLPYSLHEYRGAIEKFGPVRDLITELSYARPAFDFEVEAHTPRFLWLSKKLETIYPLRSLSHPYTIIRFPITDHTTGKIIRWRTLELQYIYDSTHRRNALIRKKSSRRFAHLKPLRKARLQHLFGNLTSAEELFLLLHSSEELTDNAQEDVAYYLGVIAFERNEYDTARKRFDELLKRFPKTRWKERVYYQQAIIAYVEGRDEEAERLLTACDQTHEGSLFHWMVATGLAQR